MVLARLFAWLDRVLGGSGAHSGLVSPESTPLPMTLGSRPARAAHEWAALLSVDGGGQSLLCAADRLTLGHLRAGRADLGFLADLGALHAVLARTDSLQDGPGWRLVPSAGERVTIDGRALPEEGQRLAADARVRLGENLEFRVLLPDLASASVVLELLHGAECAGARHIVLLARGAGGRVRIGATLAHHVRVPGLEFGLVLEWHADELHVRCEEPLEGAFLGESGRLPFPPPARLALGCGMARGSRPPFGLSLEPVPRFEALPRSETGAGGP